MSETDLLKNDKILKVDDKSAAEVGVTELGEPLRTGVYHLNVRRGDKTIQLTLTTRKLI